MLRLQVPEQALVPLAYAGTINGSRSCVIKCIIRFSRKGALPKLHRYREEDWIYANARQPGNWYQLFENYIGMNLFQYLW